MATVYEIVQGLAQAAANAYDGALKEDSDGWQNASEERERIEAGLKREEGNAILDKRVMDGFNVSFYGPMMCIKYHSEIQLKEVHANGFESEIDQKMADIASFLKKEYRNITGESVTLNKEGEVDIRVENSTRVRSWVLAKQHYMVGGLSDDMTVNEASDDRVDSNWRSFLEQGGWTGDGGKRPKNDTRPEPKND